MGVSETDVFSVEGASLTDFAPLTVDVLLTFSLSLVADEEVFDFDVCFELPPIRLRRIFHFPFPASSSGESCESIDMEEAGRVSGSDIVSLTGEGFR